MKEASTTKPPTERLLLKKMMRAVVLGLVLSIFNYYNSLSAVVSTDDTMQSRRLLSSWAQTHALSDWARYNFRPLSVAPGEKEIVLFWHIPKSGGTTAKSIYRCMDLTIASRLNPSIESRLNPSISNADENGLIVFEPFGKRGGTYVNVDMTTRSGILRAERMNLVPSGKVDILFVMEPAFAGEHLFDREHTGRILCLFRHPLKRLESKFYYLQTATWEKTYRPEWKGMDLFEWATTQKQENNIMVKKLAGLRFNDTATEAELRLAMRLVEKRFVVGLTDEMKESIRRFNIVMNVDLTSLRNQNCMRRFFGHGTLKSNSNSHPKMEPGSPAWDALAQGNALDIQLYEYILLMFDQQREVIDSYATSVNEMSL